MTKKLIVTSAITLIVLLGVSTGADANILGQHHLSWWDDLQLGVMVTAQGAPPPTPNSVHLLDLDEWHLDQAQTTAWYAGNAVAGLPANPFNPVNRTGMTPGSVIVPVAGAEGFIYQITNVNYGQGNGGPPPVPPFSFTDPAPPGPGVNDLSGINIIDTHGALAIAQPVVGSQFMWTHLGVAAPIDILDLTPGSLLGVSDWDFNAFAGPGNFEWDISPAAGAGVVVGPLGPGIFGYAMPGNWQDAINDGWVHSWNPAGGGVAVNIANGIGGFSGPVPEPTTLGLLIVSCTMLIARRRSRR